MKRFIGCGFLLVLILTCLGFPTPAASQTGAVVRASPSGVSLTAGETAQIAIRVENVAELWAFDLEVRFNPSQVTVTAVSLGPFLQQGFGFNNVDVVNGIIQYVNSQLSGSDPKTGSGDLIYITLQAVTDVEEVELTITKAELSDRDGMLIPCQIINNGSEGSFKQYLPLIVR